jgi:S1-C subfamily serine protease
MDRPDSFGHDHRKSESKGGRSGNGQIISPDQNGQTEIPDQNGQAAAPEQTSRASIGIVIRDDSGVYISQVTGENAKKAGFAEGDKIISVDGKSIGSSSDLISEIQSHSAGDTVSITVEREGQSVEISTVLE